MTARLDVTGERYGKLVAIKRLPGDIRSRWVFKCDCGQRTEAFLSNVRGGMVGSCGCAGSRSTIGIRSVKHGHTVGFKKSRTAAAWRNAKTRCFNPNSEDFPSYGGRGITMCSAWAEDFRAFFHDMGECPKGLTLDRIDVNGNYEPGNCRWATLATQFTNKRDSIWAGRLHLKDFAEAVGVPYKNLHRRIHLYGETPQEAANWYAIKSRKTAQNNKRTAHG